MLPNRPINEFKVSFADVFKSSKTLREEAENAALKRALLAANSRNGNEKAAPPVPPKRPLPATAKENKNAGPKQDPQADELDPSVFNWTAEQDVQLLRMKAENMSWRAISASLEKPAYVLKDRWGVIKPHPKATPEQSKAQQEDTKQSKDKNGKRSDRKVTFSEPLVTLENDGAVDSSASKVLYLDEAFTLEDVILLNQIATKYEEEKWIRISSRFFDKTGKRLPPRILKKHVRVE